MYSRVIKPNNTLEMSNNNTQCLLVRQPGEIFLHYRSGSCIAHAQNHVSLKHAVMMLSSSTSCPDLVESLTSTLEIGSKFSSFDDLKCSIATYEKERSVQLLQRDSRTLEAARKRVPRKVEKANKSLVYYSIIFCCSFGGKNYKCQSKGKRVHQMFVIILRFSINSLFGSLQLKLYFPNGADATGGWVL